MANKTIPELNEIDLGDILDTQLTVLDSGLETFKLRLSTLMAYLADNNRQVIELAWAGTETGAQTVDLSALSDEDRKIGDATRAIWMLKKPDASPTYGEQMPAITITTPDADTVVIDLGPYVPDPSGTYILLGV